MNRHFEVLEHCPATNQPVVLEGVAIEAHQVSTITAFFACSHARRCEQEHGSLLEVPGCRLHEVIGAPRLAPPAGSTRYGGLNPVDVAPDIADLVPVFVDNRREEVNKLRIALLAQDMAAIDRLAQRMIGGGAMFGFGAITDFGKAIRKAAIARNLPELRHAIAEYAEYLRGVRWQPSPAGADALVAG